MKGITIPLILPGILLSAMLVFLLTFLGFFTGYLIQTRGLRCWRSVDSLTLFLFALPGTVIGIGLISLWNRPWTNFIYSTPMIVILGYLAKYTALTSRISVTQLAQIPPSMEFRPPWKRQPVSPGRGGSVG